MMKGRDNTGRTYETKKIATGNRDCHIRNIINSVGHRSYEDIGDKQEDKQA